MSILIAIVFILLMLLCWGSIFFNLPGNWINLILLLIWKWTHVQMDAGWIFFLSLLLISGIAEILEFFSQIWGSKRYGGTSKGSWGALIGAIVCAIVGAPFLFGIGAIIGAVAGAFIGSLTFELVSGRNWLEAIRASKGAMFGRIFGFVAKAGLGMLMLSWSIPKVWPG